MGGRMELGVGCIAQHILPCCTTHREKWNGNSWWKCPAGQYKKQGNMACHTGVTGKHIPPHEIIPMGTNPLQKIIAI